MKHSTEHETVPAFPPASSFDSFFFLNKRSYLCWDVVNVATLAALHIFLLSPLPVHPPSRYQDGTAESIQRFCSPRGHGSHLLLRKSWFLVPRMKGTWPLGCPAPQEHRIHSLPSSSDSGAGTGEGSQNEQWVENTGLPAVSNVTFHSYPRGHHQGTSLCAPSVLGHRPGRLFVLGGSAFIYKKIVRGAKEGSSSFLISKKQRATHFTARDCLWLWWQIVQSLLLLEARCLSTSEPAWAA